jgi:nucleotide-binding universal stress UspA family protein
MATPEPSNKKKHFKVLVPTDFSEISRGAIDFVLEAFGHQLTHLIILHAYREKSPEAAPMISFVDILREKADRLMQLEVKYVQSLPKHDGVQILSISRFDGFLQSIQEISEAEDVDLIVIGSNGHTHPKLEMREEDPGFLLHKLNRPLLLVPKLLT